MRVLFINYEFPPIGGGGANATRYLFREFAKQENLTVDCVTSGLGSHDVQEDFANNIHLYRLAVGKQQKHYWTQREVLTFLLRAQPLVSRLMHENQYDCSHAFFGFPSGALSWWQRKKLPYLVSLRGSDVPGFNPRFGMQYIVLKPFFRRIWRDSGLVVANSLGLRQLANNFMPQQPIEVVPNGIDIEEFFPPEVPSLGSGQILCVSRLVERKGVQHLLEAMPQILAQAPHVSLTVAGEGDLLESLRQRCSELELAKKITFLGYVSHEQLPELYRKAELYVQPSYYEGMSNTILEAMASGLPIVATGEGGREELFSGNAETVPFGDCEALASAVGAVVCDQQRLQAMGQRSRQIAESFSWAAVAERYLEMYQDVSRGELGL